MGRKEKRKRYYFLKPGRKIYSINTYFFVKSRGEGSQVKVVPISYPWATT
jgi:hypothetical protein